jgi:predicted dehydrogenase/threonine dehydrogenase-like Zn-dependent dehydrogenase
MQQLTHQLKSGKMEILEVPFPVLSKGQVLVRNHYSVISAGTEGKTVSDARKGYIAKAKFRQKEVKMVINMMKQEGFRKTYNVVMNKLEAPSPLGYSCAGEVVAVADGLNDLRVGDKVACGGGGAVHADVVSINRNLCVKLPENVDPKHAAFTTIASIAIQGIRQADLRFGENCIVIGLGLIGLITVQVLKAAGIKAIGIDIDQTKIDKAREVGVDLALTRHQEGIAGIIRNFTKGHGTDAVIITAGSNSVDPVDFAGEICRKKGKVVIVGSVPTGFSRAKYYKKELDLRMSTSYGPGRYDPVYEEKGIDYPIGYVRFTENRNMQTFVDLLADRRINVDPLITHTFFLPEAPNAYDIILNRKEPVIGILIKYDREKELKKSVYLKTSPVDSNNSGNIGFIGAGNFAQNAVLPRLKNKCNFIGIVACRGNNSRYIADKYDFKYCSDDPDKLLEDSNIGTVFVLTRHDTHAQYVTKSLLAGKNVYVEKPLAMNFEELAIIKDAYLQAGKGLMLGFNRRFSPLIEMMMERLEGDHKKSVNIRVNAGVVPPDHWVHDPEIGGGRLIGEVCHFLDLAGFIAGSRARSVHAFALTDYPILNDTVSVNIEYENGSIASICYYSNGNKNVSKERVEVFSNGVVYSIDDFKKMDIYSEKGVKKIKLKAEDKGHSKEFDLVVRALSSGSTFPIRFDEIYHSSLLTLETVRSVNEKRVIEISD